MDIENVLKGHGIGVGGGNNIKSIQRGTTTITKIPTDITINAVKPENCIILLSYKRNAYIETHVLLFHGEIVNANTLRILNSYTSADEIVSWQVIEFDKIKSSQKGVVNATTMTASVTITSINPAKSLLIFDHTTTYATTELRYVFVEGHIENSTTLSFSQTIDMQRNIYYNIIEFD